MPSGIEKNRSRWNRFLICWVVWCSMVSLWGCATEPAAHPTGAMLVVRLLVKQEPDEAISLQVTRGDEAEPMASVNGLLYSRSGGRSVDYMFPVPLAAGRYKVSPGSGLPPFELAFEVPVGAPVYVGRLLLAQDRAPVLEDRHTDDIPMLRDAVVELRDLPINTQLGSLRQERIAEPVHIDALVGGTAPDGGGATANSGAIEVVVATEKLVEHLPVASREGFKRYLRLRSPRAFAVSEEGLFGVGSGRGAVELAMQECNKLAPKKGCRLFSVDQSATLRTGCVARTNRSNWWLRLSDVAPQEAGKRTSACSTWP